MVQVQKNYEQKSSTKFLFISDNCNHKQAIANKDPSRWSTGSITV